MKSNKSITELIEEMLPGKKARMRAAGRLMSLSEESSEKTIELLRELSSFPKPRIILGITGAPGSGKSFLSGRIIEYFRKKYPDRMIGIIAIDPSSPFSGGAILGDRIRMMKHSDDPHVFIRSISSRGQLGGVTLGTMGIISVMGALGCDVVLVETVGVGQMEFAIKDVSDMVAIVLAPGQGDTVQFLKAGLMEIGDIFILNKDDKPGSIQFYAQLLLALRLMGHNKEQKELIPRVSALLNRGIPELFDSIEKHFSADSEERGFLRRKRLELLVKRVISFELQKKMEMILEKEESNFLEEILKSKKPISSFLSDLIRKMQ